MTGVIDVSSCSNAISTRATNKPISAQTDNDKTDEYE
jgi:hypothetical protein